MKYYINNELTQINFWAEQLRLAVMESFANKSGKRYTISEYLKIYNKLLNGNVITYKGVAFKVEVE